jgi:hypothetical protein
MKTLNLAIGIHVRLFSLIAIAGALVFTAAAQTPSPTPTPTTATATAQTAAAPPAAKPADVVSVDAIVAALYDVISGPAGKRDWDRFRSLFIPGARLIPTGVRQTGEVVSRVVTPEDYVQRNGPFFEKEGFFEREAARRTETFGNIAHVFSTYESRHAKDESKPFQRGINSIQLMNDGKRWWIVTVFWQAEDEKNPLPEKYLEGKK